MFDDWTCYVINIEFWTRNQFYENLNEKQINKNLNEQQIEKKIVYQTIKYRNHDWLYSFVIIISFNLESEFEFEKSKITKTNYFNITNIQQMISKHSIIRFSMTNVNFFKFSMIHNNHDKSKTSRRLKKSAQLVETFIQNEFFTFKSYLKKQC